jgi:hypothetical protein
MENETKKQYLMVQRNNDDIRNKNNCRDVPKRAKRAGKAGQKAL